VRAERRWRQLGARGERVPIEAVLEDIRIRDQRDSARADAPLIQAQDAVLLDTSDMSIEEAADAARRIVETARAQGDNPEG
jgi:cytidylate kinase